MDDFSGYRLFHPPGPIDPPLDTLPDLEKIPPVVQTPVFPGPGTGYEKEFVDSCRFSRGSQEPGKPDQPAIDHP